jgi:IS5 family transposase
MPAERRDSVGASPRWSPPMQPKSSPPEQPELFRSALVNLVDPKHPLVRLAGLIDWERFRTAFGPLSRDGVGRPGLPTRLMVGLHLIKHMDGLSDEAVCARFLDSPYVQLFCGETHVQHALPLDRSSMTRWRKRIGAERLELLLAETLATAQRTGAAEPKHVARVTIDTTVQPKAVTHPTDSKLIHRGVEILGRARPPARRAHHPRHRAPLGHRAGGGPDRGDGGRPRRRAGDARRADGAGWALRAAGPHAGLRGMTPLPDPNVLQPLTHAPGLVLLKPLLARGPEVANVTAGPFGDYHDFDDGLGVLSRNVLYNQGISGARLRSGAYCAIAHGAHFVMPDANHAMAGLSHLPLRDFRRRVRGGAAARRLSMAARARHRGRQRCLDRHGRAGAAGRDDRRRRHHRRRRGGGVRRAGLRGGGRQPGARGADALRCRDGRAAEAPRLVGLAGGARRARCRRW